MKYFRRKSQSLSILPRTEVNNFLLSIKVTKSTVCDLNSYPCKNKSSVLDQRNYWEKSLVNRPNTFDISDTTVTLKLSQGKLLAQLPKLV